MEIKELQKERKKEIDKYVNEKDKIQKKYLEEKNKQHNDLKKKLEAIDKQIEGKKKVFANKQATTVKQVMGEIKKGINNILDKVIRLGNFLSSVSSLIL